MGVITIHHVDLNICQYFYVSLITMVLPHTNFFYCLLTVSVKPFATNWLCLAKCYLYINQKEEARKWLSRLVDLQHSGSTLDEHVSIMNLKLTIIIDYLCLYKIFCI